MQYNRSVTWTCTFWIFINMDIKSLLHQKYPCKKNNKIKNQITMKIQFNISLPDWIYLLLTAPHGLLHSWLLCHLILHWNTQTSEIVWLCRKCKVVPSQKQMCMLSLLEMYRGMLNYEISFSRTQLKHFPEHIEVQIIIKSLHIFLYLFFFTAFINRMLTWRITCFKKILCRPNPMPMWA